MQEHKTIINFFEKKWKYFQYEQLFDIMNGSNKVSEIIRKGKTPLVSALKNRNGVSGYINSKPKFDGNVITVNNNGNAGAGIAFYQPIPFCATVDVNVLKPKFSLNEKHAMFLITLIRKEHFRYSFARKWKPEKMNKSILKLPINKDGEPDWQFMEVCVSNIESKISQNILTEDSITKKQIKLTDRKWKYFVYNKLFDIRKGKRLVVSQLNEDTTKGVCPHISSIDKNNGVSHRINVKPNHKKNTITINYDGSVGETYYQSEDYWASDSVNVLYPEFELNPYIAMFLIVLLKKEKYRFNYYRKWSSEKMNETTISLPVTEDGEPDWQFMEDYIKSLPYSSNLAN